ncbi:MAG: hypothetical protein D6718_02160 [Acidobacteria bacterium]|nr:MAG: hypothetical protein D6718_02160 [Acidobacteriota bacterium]
MPEGRSALFYVMIGCLSVLLLGATCVGGCIVLTVRFARQVERTQVNPDARTAKALEILGAERLPEGYRAVAALEIPFFARMAIISTGEAGDESRPELGDRGLIYLDLIHMGGNEEDLRDFFEGRTDDPEALRRGGVHIDVQEIIRRGVIRAGGAEILYVAERGSISTQGHRASGVTAVCLVQCPQDHRRRVAMWYASESEASGKDGLEGTPADEEALVAFLNRFRFCGQR